MQPYVVNKWSLPLLIPFGLLLAAAAPFIGVASAYCRAFVPVYLHTLNHTTPYSTPHPQTQTQTTTTVTVGLPLLFPLLLLGLVAALTVLAAGLILALSSRTGRARVEAVMDPIVRKLTHTSTGQQLLYETGPRPSPLKVAKTFAPKGKWERLLLSLALDTVGASSYLVPVLGELTDLAWAPIFAICVAAMYSESSPYAHYVGLIEELLPFTDIIPTATLAWFRENGAALAKDLHLNVLAGQRRSAP